jgi:hypothetical protein
MTIALVPDVPDARFDEYFPCDPDDAELGVRPLRAMSADQVLKAFDLCRREIEEDQAEPHDDWPEQVRSMAYAHCRYGRLLVMVLSQIPREFHQDITMVDAVRRFWPGGR